MNTPFRAFPYRSGIRGVAEEASQNVEAVAERVEKRAERTERRPKVGTRTDTGGAKVVEQVSEAPYYGKGFHGKKTTGGEQFDQGDLTASRTLCTRSGRKRK